MFKFLFFGHVTPLIRRGHQRSIDASDVFELPHHLSPRVNTVDEKSVDWSDWWKLLSSLFWQLRKSWFPAYVFIVLCALFSLASPVLVYEFVASIEKTNQDWLWTGLLGIGIGLSGLISGICVQHYFFRALEVYQVATNTLNRKIFDHSLKLSKGARDKLPVGDVVNHMSSDSDSLANMGTIVGDLVYNFVLISGFVALLFYYMGHAAWVGLIVLFAVVPLTKYIGRLFSGLDEQLMKKRDERVSLMSQILTGIRVVKYFTWEKSVSREVQKIRHDEVRIRARLARAEMGSTVIYVAVGTLVLFTVLGAHILMGRPLEAALIFACVSLFRLVEDPFAMFSRIIAQLANARVAARRISQFLKEPEKPVSSQLPLGHEPAVALRVKNLSLSFDGVPVLRNISFEVFKGENFAIVGPVGAGKSSILYALLGELSNEGEIFGHSDWQKVFVPQEAYIINSTLRENLSFGRSGVTSDDWSRALHAACLDEDLAQMRAGLDTEIGERGVSLSGGQKQRISLARCVLQNPELVYLDDPLSAVDPRTEALLMERLILGEWKNKTRVTVTHRLEHLRSFDRILFLSGGEAKGLGTEDELMALSPEFREFVRDHKAAEQAEFDAGETKTDIGDEKTKQIKEAVTEALVERVTEDEDRERGAVSGSVYVEYIKSLGGAVPARRPWILAAMVGVAILATSLPLVQKTWLAWVSNYQSESADLAGRAPWGMSFLAPLLGSPSAAVLIYGLLGLAILAGVLLSDLYWLKRGLRAGRALHDDMLRSILRAEIRFFDSTPVGRVLQRFSRDLESIDVELQWSFENSVKSLVQVVVNLALIVAVLPAIGLFLLPVFFVYYRIQKLYRGTAREVKRLDSVTRSPRYAHFKETLQGLVVLRSFGREEWFWDEFSNRLAANQQMFYSHVLVNRWFSSRIPVVGAMIAMVTTTLITVSVVQGHMTPGLAGLVTVSSIGFLGVLNWGIRIWAEVEARMTSVERIKSFIALPSEGGGEVHELRASWPEKAEVEFKDVKLRYAKHLPLVLHGLSFKIKGGSRVGLIGRTGSGKSTVFQSLYRFLECEEGEILIDGVNIAHISLPRLRRAIAIIPQDPTLFLGTLRSNLDRFQAATDQEIWAVLEKVKLAEFVRSLPAGLLAEVVENGANLSQGQRQLICLARALLIRAKIIVLDEATASVDVQTDSLVQSVIREACVGMTMIVIAHRLGTVKDCDQILELQSGRLKRKIFPRARLGVGGKKTDETQPEHSDPSLQRTEPIAVDARSSEGHRGK